MTEEKQVAEEQPQVVEQQEEVAQESPKEQPKASPDQNWEQVRQVLSLQKQKIEELEARLSQKDVAKEQDEEDEFANLDPEDLITVGKSMEISKKLVSKEAAKTAKQIVQEYAREQSLQQDETRMRGKHEDYDFVVENYAIPLIKNDPALAYKIQHSKNPAETAYKLGKLSDAYEENVMKQQTSPKAEKVLKNTSRPVSSAASGSPLKSQADQFSKMSPSEIWAMSQKYAKGA